MLLTYIHPASTFVWTQGGLLIFHAFLLITSTTTFELFAHEKVMVALYVLRLALLPDKLSIFFFKILRSLGTLTTSTQLFFRSAEASPTI